MTEVSGRYIGASDSSQVLSALLDMAKMGPVRVELKDEHYSIVDLDAWLEAQKDKKAK